jgi:hypothetical protein
VHWLIWLESNQNRPKVQGEELTGRAGPANSCGPVSRRVSENRLMNRRISVWVGSILGLGWGFLWFAAVAAGQDSPDTSSLGTSGAGISGITAGTIIPAAALAAPSEAPYAAAINGFIQEQLTALSGTDYAAQTTAHDKLKAALSRGDSPAYYSTFARDWSANAAAILARGPALGVRLNIAIVSATLAENGETLDVQPLVLQLLKDREPCVVLWGIKAARPLVLVLVENQPAATVEASPLLSAIVGAVRNCEKSDVSGFATVDAYSALAVSIPGKTEQEMKAYRPPLVKSVLDVVQLRVSQHADGLVQSPGAERYIATWLSGTFPDLASNPREQTRLVQLLVDLETYVGQRADLYQYDKKAMQQIREMLKYVTSALKVIGEPGVGSRLDWLTGIPPAAKPEDIFAKTREVYGTMNLVFNTIIKPAEIPVIAPPPPPPVPTPAVKPAAPVPTP